MNVCVKVCEKGQPKRSGLLRELLQHGRENPTQHPLISLFDSASPSLQQLTEQIAIINFSVGNSSIGTRVPIHKFWRGMVCSSAAAYKRFVITSQQLSVSSLGWTFAFIPTTLTCSVPSFDLHFVALQQPENDLIYTSKHRFVQIWYWFQWSVNRSIYTCFGFPSHCKSNLWSLWE